MHVIKFRVHKNITFLPDSCFPPRIKSKIKCIRTFSSYSCHYRPIS